MENFIRNGPSLITTAATDSLFVQTGTTSSGTPVRMRKDLLKATSIVTMGPICHHYFAGYGGGRKLIFPGCGEREAIYHNHGLFLDRPKRNLTVQCQPGNLQQNPLADDLFEIQNHLPAQLAIHGIQDSKGKICDFIIGADKLTYLDACSIHASCYEISCPAVRHCHRLMWRLPKGYKLSSRHTKLFITVLVSCGTRAG